MATYSQLKEYARRNFFDQDDSKSETVIGEIVNESIRLIAQAGKWPSLLTEGRINTSAVYNSGHINMAANSNSATFTSASIPSSIDSTWVMIVGRFSLRVDDRISSTSITTKPGEVVFTDASAGTYFLAKSKYSLPADMRVFVDIDTTEQQFGRIQYMEPNEYYTYVQANPRWYSFPYIYTKDNHNVMFYPYPNQRYHYRFMYYRWPKEMSASADVMDFPDSYVDLVHDSMRICVEAHRKNIAPDEAVERVTQLAKRVMSRDNVRQGTMSIRPQVRLGWTVPDHVSPWPGYMTMQ